MSCLELNVTALVGYIGTAILLSSFAVKKLKSLRIVNSFAFLLFVTYGILLSKA